MKVLFQWTRKNPGPFEEYSSSDWPRLCKDHKRPEPTGGEVINDATGFIHAMNVQGCGFGTPDHVHLREIDDETIEVVTWCDDDEDYPDGRKWASVKRFKDLAPDPVHGGAWNTRQTITIYAQEECPHWINRADPRESVTILPWSEFVKPLEEETIHTTWVGTFLHETHQEVQVRSGQHTWHEWTKGVPRRYVSKGQVVTQRERGLYKKPRGTRTVFQRDTNLATGVHVVNHENELNDAAGAGETEQSQAYGGGASNLEYVYTSAAGFPNDAAWPTGDYRCQLDCSANTDMDNFSYGLLSLNGGGAVGHFARVNTGLTSDSESKAQAESAFTGAGLKLATTGSVSWSTGSASDRFECLVAVFRSTNHGNATITMQFNSDGFADGPWTAPATVGIGQPRTLVIPPGARVQKQHPLSRECEAYWIPKRGVDALTTLPEVVDLTGHRHGAVGTGTLLVRGVTPRGPSIRFVDTGSFVQIPDHERLGGTPTGLTIACVFQGCEAVSGSIDGVLMQKDDPAATHHWALEITNTDGFGSFHMNTDSGGNEDVEDNVDISVNADSRTHVLMGTWDGANMRLYRDGLFAVGAAKTGTPSSSTNDIFLGRHADITNRGVTGHILMWVYWRRALTVDEARAFAADPTAMIRKDTFGGLGPPATLVTSDRLLRFDVVEDVIQTLLLRLDLTGNITQTSAPLFDLVESATATVLTRFDLVEQALRDAAILFDLAETIETTALLRFDTVVQIEQIRGMRFDLATQVQKTAALLFDALERATATGLLRFDLAGMLNPPKTATLRFDTVVEVETTQGMRFDTLQRITQTAAALFDVLQRATGTRLLRFDLAGMLNPPKTAALHFDTLESAEATRAALFDLLERATRTELERFDLIGQPVATVPIRFDLSETITGTVPLRFDLLVQVEATELERFDTLEQVQKTVQARFDLLGDVIRTALARFDLAEPIVLRDALIHFDTLESIQAQAVVLFDLLGDVEATRAALFDTIGAVEKTAGLRLDLLGDVLKTALGRFDTLGDVIRTSGARFDTLTRATQTEGLRFDLIGQVIGTVPVRFDLQGTITKTGLIRFDLSLDVTITKDAILRFDTLELVTKDGTIRFDLKGGQGTGRELLALLGGIHLEGRSRHLDAR